MKKRFGISLMVLAVLLYLLGVFVLAKEVHYSMRGLWLTLTDGALLGSFLASALGAFAPGAVVHYIGYRLARSTPAVVSVTPVLSQAAHESAVPVASNLSKTVPPESHSTMPLQAIVDEDRVYTEIAQELETGVADKGLWTRLFAECGGDEKQTKVLYIKQRAERLISAERLRFEQAQAERERAAETMRLEELRLQSLEQEDRLVPDPVTLQPGITNIPSAAQLQSESQRNDEFAGWILMAIVVGIALLTAALMQVK